MLKRGVLWALILCHVPAMEVPEAEEDIDLSLVILSDAFFESKLLSTVFEA